MPPRSPSRPPALLFADTHRSADMLHFGHFSAPDPFLAFEAGGKKIAVLNALEFVRALKHSAFDLVLPLEPWLARARKTFPDPRPGIAEVAFLLARKFRLKTFAVPPDFPLQLADRLRTLGLTLTPFSPLFPEREIKTRAQAEAIRQGNAASSAGFAAAEKILRASRLRGNSLLHQGSPLTSERLRTAIEIACLEVGAVSQDTIVAGGDQACDPHERGHGPLRPRELIIIDIFPRVSASGFHGDMTRTFLRGRASDAQRSLVQAVRDAQLAAFSVLRAGAEGRAVHQRCVDLFESRGYKTSTTAQGASGFFHGTGHGLGLEVHEAPRLGTSGDSPLKAGTVVTVEPGLYYPGLGGCRIEDVAQITSRLPRLLSSYPYDWELR